MWITVIRYPSLIRYPLRIFPVNEPWRAGPYPPRYRERSLPPSLAGKGVRGLGNPANPGWLSLEARPSSPAQFEAVFDTASVWPCPPGVQQDQIAHLPGEPVGQIFRLDGATQEM